MALRTHMARRPWTRSGGLLGGLLVLAAAGPAQAAGGALSLEPAQVLSADAHATGAAPDGQTPAGRYFFGLLDGRSQYAQAWVPGGFLNGPLTPARELGWVYQHGEGAGQISDQVAAEVSWSQGNLGLTLAGSWTGGYERSDVGAATHTQAWDDVVLSVYHPVLQWVSAGGGVDYTLVGQLNLAMPLAEHPAHSDWIVTPLAGQVLIIGRRLVVQTWTGLDIAIGPEEGGTHVFQYGASAAWLVEDHLPPFLTGVAPVLELHGQTQVTGADAGRNQLYGLVGLRAQFAQVGPETTELGLGVALPLDAGARAEEEWAVVSTLTFGF